MPSRYLMSTEQAKQLSYEQITRLSDAELKSISRQLLDVATKRYKSAEKKWGDIGATKSYAEHSNHGQVSLKGKSRAEIIKATVRAQSFLQSKTSTEKGRKQVKEKFEKTMGQKLTVEQYKQLWNIYNKVEELQKAGMIDGYYAINYKTLIKDITSEIKSGTAETYLTNAQQNIDRLYENYQTKGALTDDDLSGLEGFDFGDLII